MSTNEKIRKIAERLPPVPKLHNDKIQRDSKGDIIMLNHFREIKAIYDECGNDVDKRNAMCGGYVKACFDYDEFVSKRVNSKIREALILKVAEALLWFIIAASLVKIVWPT